MLDGSAFLTMSKCPAVKELKKLWDSIIDQRRLLQTFLPAEAVEEFAREDSNVFQEWNATADHARATIATFCSAQALFKVAEADSARKALLQSCDIWMKDNGVRESLTPKLSILASKALAKDKQQHTSLDHHQCAATHMLGLSGSMVCIAGKFEL